MRSRRFLLLCSVIVVAGLVGCTSAPEPDWPAIEREADEFEQAASADEGVLGSGMLRIEQSDSHTSDVGEIAWTFGESMQVEAVTVACFGAGAARVGYVTRTHSSWTGGDAIELDCDGTVQLMPLDAPASHVNAVEVSGELASGTGGLLVWLVSGAEE